MENVDTMRIRVVRLVDHLANRIEDGLKRLARRFDNSEITRKLINKEDLMRKGTAWRKWLIKAMDVKRDNLARCSGRRADRRRTFGNSELGYAARDAGTGDKSV
jgi:hypothetical protein